MNEQHQQKKTLVMNKLYAIVGVLILMLAGCQKQVKRSSPESGSEGFAVQVSLIPENVQSVELQSKSLTPDQEKSIRDANIYCFHKTTGICKRAFIGKNSASLNLIGGVWDLFVIANHGSDLGVKTRAQVEALAMSVSSEADLRRNSVLPMSGTKTITVSGKTSVLIQVSRIVAKVDVSVTVDPALVSRIKLKSISLVNVPGRCGYFQTNAPKSGMITYPEQSCVNGVSTSFYMFENRQGVNSAVTDQKYKGKSNAPAYATYIHIKAEMDGAALDYYIYPGENNTTDFNIKGNKSYVISI